MTGAEGQDGLFASAVTDRNNHTLIVKMANTGDRAQSLRLTFKGLDKQEQLVGGRCITLSSPDPDADNTIGHPDIVVPVESALEVTDQHLDVELQPQTFAVYVLQLTK